MSADKAPKPTDADVWIEAVAVFYHSPVGMVLAEQHDPIWIVCEAPPSPFYYVRLADYLDQSEKKVCCGRGGTRSVCVNARYAI